MSYDFYRKHDKLLTLFLLLFLLFINGGKAQTISWKQVAPGVWKGIVGRPEAYDLLKAAGISPNIKAMNTIKRLGSAKP